MVSRSPLLFRAVVLAAAVLAVPACKSNSNLAAPQLIAVLPATGASTGISISPNIIFQFDRAMDNAFVSNPIYFELIPGTAASGIPITVEHLPALNEVRIIPTALLLLNTTYTVVVSGQVQSAAGTPIGSNVGFTFTTQTATTTTSAISFTTPVGATGANAGEITLTWTAATETPGPVNVSNYDIYYSTTLGGEDLMLPAQKVSASATGDLLTGLTPATLYYIKVQPRDSAGAVLLAPLTEFTATSK
ncbi:MAG TPA: Ig-like domain-containing protein [Planctomycetota bacterium]|nr:Ig-like domain-containing protein [Planctomycetota bacterium]